MNRINAIDAYVLYKQTTFRVLSWTSRVRSPSPALLRERARVIPLDSKLITEHSKRQGLAPRSSIRGYVKRASPWLVADNLSSGRNGGRATDTRSVRRRRRLRSNGAVFSNSLGWLVATAGKWPQMSRRLPIHVVNDKGHCPATSGR
jgi:hypothetical protein